MQRATALPFLPSLFLAATAFRLLSAQTIGFEPVDLYSTGHEPEAFVIVDLNADGRLDVAIANSSDSFVGEETVTVLLGDGEGGFAPGDNFPECLAPGIVGDPQARDDLLHEVTRL